MLTSIQYEKDILKRQLPYFQEVRENTALLENGHLGPSEHIIRAELDVIEGSITDACASLSLWVMLLDQLPNGEPQSEGLILSQWANTLRTLPTTPASVSSIPTSSRLVSAKPVIAKPVNTQSLLVNTRQSPILGADM
ncbi:hypothetical protein PG993_010756 [Apiospora rasikravindrae]|uniref:Uncharacterized protein n=1 Tax=Apiospora rasikravindrae TaxID=990691 RepID=A0ABR1SC72_9PEZI